MGHYVRANEQERNEAARELGRRIGRPLQDLPEDEFVRLVVSEMMKDRSLLDVLYYGRRAVQA